MKDIKDYPNFGIANMSSSLIDLIASFLNLEKLRYQKIIINTSSQPNSSPHIGTITTLFSAFLLAKELRERLKVPVEVLFDELENAPYKPLRLPTGYYESLDCVPSKVVKGSIADQYMANYKKIFSIISSKTKISYRIRTYKNFQKNYFFRNNLYKIFKDIKFFENLLQPEDKKLHIRISCPLCNITAKNSALINYCIDGQYITFKSSCPKHGSFKKRVNIFQMTNYLDVNTQLRDVLKGAMSLDELDKNKVLTIMFDSADWSGLWYERVHINGLLRLGYSKIPLRLFSPLILDNDGFKLSKSLYINDKEYLEKYSKLLDSSVLAEDLSVKRLINEINQWVTKTNRFCRSYSVDYMKGVLFNE